MTDQPNIIKRLRLAVPGLTQEALAERLGGTWKQCRISNLEREHRESQEPRPKTVLLIAKACGKKAILTADGWQIEP